jgi:DNA-directed RNA polymerase subunit RPC12/RpoP
MATRTFSCSKCNESFSVHPPENVTRADSSKCQDIDTNYHNLVRTIECQNCEHRNIIYYCTETHPILADD